MSAAPLPSTPASGDSGQLRGVVFAVLAFTAWGLTAVYFKALRDVPPLQIAAHRVVWAVLFLLVLLAAMGRLRPLLRARPSARSFAVYAVTAPLIGCNWLLYIWAVNSGRLLEASLGYFINPLVNVLLGLVFLREPLNRRQTIAVLLAATGVLYQVIQLGTLPWVSLVLATSFGVYGLLRKKANVDPMGGLLVETALLAPAAVVYLAVVDSAGGGAFMRSGAQTTALLLAAGAITALPLIWFQLGANRLRLSTIGLIQYLSPTCQFLLAVGVYGEAFSRGHAVTFAFIWASLALYTFDAVQRQRRLGVASAAAAARG